MKNNITLKMFYRIFHFLIALRFQQLLAIFLIYRSMTKEKSFSRLNIDITDSHPIISNG